MRSFCEQFFIFPIYFACFLFCYSPVCFADQHLQSTDDKGIVIEKPSDQPSVPCSKGYMVCYTDRIPGTNITFEMVPIPGGEFLLGSDPKEEGRNDDEGPQVLLKVSPFWMAKYEVTWVEYQAYMGTYEAFKSLSSLRTEKKRFGLESQKLKPLATVQKYLAQESVGIDGVTSPTPLYDSSFTYAVGEEPDQPAITMSQYAAKQYTKWLSGITGNQYRLPSEIEWEYAARAGTTTPFSFSPEESLDDYAWYAANSEDQLHSVGTKRPNPWGLHDMHGNVAEWVLDGYDEQHYSEINQEAEVLDSIDWPTTLYPRVIRGGCWFDGAAQCRSAARHKSDDSEWTASDPNLPVSPWWFTEEPSTGVGFRLMRPLNAMSTEFKARVWEADVDDIRQDVADRILEGRGTQSGAHPLLPAAIEELESAGLIE